MLSKLAQFSIFLFAFLSCVQTKRVKQTITARKTPSKMFSDVSIAFGSFYSPQGIQNPDIFEKIREFIPDTFIWLGETIVSEEEHTNENDEILNLKRSPGYLHLSQKTHITGVSDFGKSNESAKNLFFYFLEEEYQSHRRSSNKLYDAFWIKTQPSQYNDNEQVFVKVILLEVDKIEDDSEEITDEQFAWLSEELREEKEGHFLTVIASPYQILSHDKIYDESIEVSNKLRLLKLIRRSSAPVVLISGTLSHAFGEVLRYPCSQEEIGYDLYELTSAGLNTDLDFDFRKVNKLMVPPTFNNFTNRAFKPNFGLLRIKYNHVKPSTSEIYFEIVNQSGKMLVSKSVYIPEKSRYTEKQTDMKLTCAKMLYSHEQTFLALGKHLMNMIRDPEFKLYFLAVGLIFACLFLVLLLCAARAFGNKLGGGGGRYFDEYEKYHME